MVTCQKMIRFFYEGEYFEMRESLESAIFCTFDEE